MPAIWPPRPRDIHTFAVERVFNALSQDFLAHVDALFITDLASRGTSSTQTPPTRR
jgi:hypothetical protein